MAALYSEQIWSQSDKKRRSFVFDENGERDESQTISNC